MRQCPFDPASPQSTLLSLITRRTVKVHGNLGARKSQQLRIPAAPRKTKSSWTKSQLLSKSQSRRLSTLGGKVLKEMGVEMKGSGCQTSQATNGSLQLEQPSGKPEHQDHNAVQSGPRRAQRHGPAQDYRS